MASSNSSDVLQNVFVIGVLVLIVFVLYRCATMSCDCSDTKEHFFVSATDPGQCCGGSNHGATCTQQNQCDSGKCWADITSGCAAPGTQPAVNPNTYPPNTPKPAQPVYTQPCAKCVDPKFAYMNSPCDAMCKALGQGYTGGTCPDANQTDKSNCCKCTKTTTTPAPQTKPCSQCVSPAYKNVDNPCDAMCKAIGATGGTCPNPDSKDGANCCDCTKKTTTPAPANTKAPLVDPCAGTAPKGTLIYSTSRSWKSPCAPKNKSTAASYARSKNCCMGKYDMKEKKTGDPCAGWNYHCATGPGDFRAN